ncbi:MAG: serine/threonine protein kinase [Tannerella sp.]|nr:serine/threonine protein kinase [Tannerella sp.]
MLKESTIVKERYSLLKILGKGGFSEVWLADDVWTSTKVALKFYAPGTGLDDEGIRLFTHEFALLSDLNHNNLLKPSHFDIYENMPFLVLTYCENGSTLRLVNRMNEDSAWQFLRDVAEGLHYLHSNVPPIIHQDIKPDNILIDRNSRFVITDFGISARARNTLRRNVTNITTGGTLAYMSPERFGHDPSPIKASDIYSLGATMFELLTGHLPFGDHGGLLQKNGADIPNIKGNYSNRLKEIVYQCLAINTWDRPTAFYISRFAKMALDGDEDGMMRAERQKVKSTFARGAFDPEIPNGDDDAMMRTERQKANPVFVRDPFDPDMSNGDDDGKMRAGRQRANPVFVRDSFDPEMPNSNSGVWKKSEPGSFGNNRNSGVDGNKKLAAGLIAGLSFVVIIIVSFFVINKIPDKLDKKKLINQYDYYINQGDSLHAVGQKEDPNFERMYVDALKSYRMALETVENTGELSLINDARGKVDNMRKLISETYDEFLNKAKKMKEYEALEAAAVFTERAGYLKDFR